MQNPANTVAWLPASLQMLVAPISLLLDTRSFLQPLSNSTMQTLELFYVLLVTLGAPVAADRPDERHEAVLERDGHGLWTNFYSKFSASVHSAPALPSVLACVCVGSTAHCNAVHKVLSSVYAQRPGRN